MIINYFPTTAE